MPKRHGNWLSDKESHLTSLTLRVPTTTADEIAELQRLTGLCKRDVIKTAIRLFAERERTPVSKLREPREPTRRDPAPAHDQPYFYKPH